MPSYTKKYIYIYVTHGVSMILGLISLFIVMPFLSSNQELYGIYAICSSLTVFFSYADLGFVSSGQKFASEYYIKNDRKTEMGILGFTTLILFSFLAFISIGIFLLSYNPSLIIKDISGEDMLTARHLMITLALSSPIYCFQRISHIIYAARLADYYFQVLQIIGSVIKILSVFYFFGNGRYDIVGYYITFQLANALVVSTSLILAKKKFNVSFLNILKNARFNKEIFDLLKGLAFASLYGSICMILMYELDNLMISTFLGATAVAIYASAFTLLTFFRNIFNILYMPYMSRFNYFVGLKDINGLNKFVKTIIEFFLPFTVIPIVVMLFEAKPFIHTWIGSEYDMSANVLSALLVGILFTFITTPSGIYITSLQKNRYLYINNTICVVIYWGGVLLTIGSLGVMSFASMKVLGMIVSAIFVYFVTFNLLKENKIEFIWKMIRIYSIPIAACVICCILIKPYMKYDKDTMGLLTNIVFMGGIIILGYLSVLPFSKIQRALLRRIVEMKAK